MGVRRLEGMTVRGWAVAVVTWSVLWILVLGTLYLISSHLLTIY